MRRMFLLLPMLALIPWIACNEQPNSPTAQGGDYQTEQFPSQFPEQKPALQVMEGTLTKVDSAGRMIWIRTTDGSESMFSYSDTTLVAGAGNTLEGLAKVNGSRVKIRYTTSGEGNSAEEIEILSEGGPNPTGAKDGGKN